MFLPYHYWKWGWRGQKGYCQCQHSESASFRAASDFQWFLHTALWWWVQDEEIFAAGKVEGKYTETGGARKPQNSLILYNMSLQKFCYLWLIIPLIPFNYKPSWYQISELENQVMVRLKLWEKQGVESSGNNYFFMIWDINQYTDWPTLLCCGSIGWHLPPWMALRVIPSSLV